MRPDQIGIISPYAAQTDGLSVRLHDDFPDLEIKSVDGFQGREKEVIIFSMVRSNVHGNIGFLRYNQF